MINNYTRSPVLSMPMIRDRMRRRVTAHYALRTSIEARSGSRRRLTNRRDIDECAVFSGSIARARARLPRRPGSRSQHRRQPRPDAEQCRSHGGLAWIRVGRPGPSSEEPSCCDGQARTGVSAVSPGQDAAGTRPGAEEPGPARCGVVTVVQRFRSDLGLYVHLHCLVTDGAYEEQGDELRFLAAAPPTPERMTAVLAQVHEVVRAADDDLDIDPALAACLQLSLAGPHLAPGSPSAPHSPGRLHSVMLAHGDRHFSTAPGTPSTATVQRIVGADPAFGLGHVRMRLLGSGGQHSPVLNNFTTVSFTSGSVNHTYFPFGNPMPTGTAFVKCVMNTPEDMSAKSDISNLDLKLRVLLPDTNGNCVTSGSQQASRSDISFDTKSMVAFTSADTTLPGRCLEVTLLKGHVTSSGVTAMAMCYLSNKIDDES